MNRYVVRMEVPEGELKRIFDRMTKAQETIFECYNELSRLGVVVFKETPAAANDNDARGEGQ